MCVCVCVCMCMCVCMCQACIRVCLHACLHESVQEFSVSLHVCGVLWDMGWNSKRSELIEGERIQSIIPCLVTFYD